MCSDNINLPVFRTISKNFAEIGHHLPAILYKAGLPMFNYRDWIFIYWTLGCAFLAGLAALVTMYLSVWIALLVMPYFFTRLSIALPATAEGFMPSIQKVWSLTHKNGWRLVAVTCFLPATTLIFSILLDSFGMATASNLVVAIATPCIFVYGVFSMASAFNFLKTSPYFDLKRFESVVETHPVIS